MAEPIRDDVAGTDIENMDAKWDVYFDGDGHDHPKDKVSASLLAYLDQSTEVSSNASSYFAQGCIKYIIYFAAGHSMVFFHLIVEPDEVLLLAEENYERHIVSCA